MTSIHKTSQQVEVRQEHEKRVAPIYLTNKVSATLVIPIGMARRKGLDKPTNVVVEETDQGILIKKLDI